MHQEAAKKRFDAAGFTDVTFFEGIHAKSFGLRTEKQFQLGGPGFEYSISAHSVGNILGHFMIWSSLAFMTAKEEDYWWVLENDADFYPNWKRVLDESLQDGDVPDDWDIIFPGSCNTKGKMVEPVGTHLYRVEYPLCTHAMIIRRKALSVLLETQAIAWAPIDIQLNLLTLPKLKTYTVLPRVVGQIATWINP